MNNFKKLPLLLKKQSKFPTIFIFLFSISLTIGCKEAKTPEKDDIDELEIEETTIEDSSENDVERLVIDEHQVNDLSITSAASSNDQNSTKAKPNTDETTRTQETEEEKTDVEETEVNYEVYPVETLHSGLSELDYESYEVTEAIIPLSETQTVVGFNKRGKYKDSLQVISQGDGTIDQIIFTHKKHKDVYDVQAGMSAKEVKKLRRELKHMVKKGKVFLYSDTSNIMYLLDAQNAEGDEIMEADIATMTVEAIIWNDKN